ncbi:MAG: glycosyltransferase family 4 protein [Cytophagales bacterium]
MRIVAVHLLNDYSGSPKVLMQLTKGWIQRGFDVTVATCLNRHGFLSDLQGVHYLNYGYKWKANPLLRLVHFMASQLILFVKLIRIVERKDTIYVNTVLPFGAALAGKIKGCRVIYHVHETSMKPRMLKSFLFGIMRWAASDVVYVSCYLQKQEPTKGKPAHVLYNALEANFLSIARQIKRTPRTPRNILMVCSLKRYKGVNEFIGLAKLNPHLQFKLVVNASQSEVNDFQKEIALTSNVSIAPTQINLHPFYQWADIILNLSKPDEWIETFGLTIIEGMAYGLPAIVPPIGGIAEIVKHGVNGFWADCRDLKNLSKRLNDLCSPTIYEAFSAKSFEMANRFQENVFHLKSSEMLLRSSRGKIFQPVETCF